ncbi:AN1-like zinc finger family protein [Plasmodium gonderi]|uniref:AN1-like zinc finger family protein n=1 Tax=Plasmodium gonderi TaxID=77519 RepID=A0A1Y1JN85_PLAGO|nr:AN1-like zinc finger family protein [Plasmodium gonderi]GAW81514.1 AN1-like zinc finger family protein [Plasmodium gonderi]
MAYFSDFAKKCDLDGCRNHDFLPFKCEYCGLSFCELHRKIQEHACANLKNADLKKVVLCKYCNGVLPDKMEEIEKHLIYKCTFKKKKNSIMICYKKDCKTVLNGINNYTCKKCKKNFCLPHRYSDAHGCVKENSEKSFFKNVQMCRCADVPVHSSAQCCTRRRGWVVDLRHEGIIGKYGFPVLSTKGKNKSTIDNLETKPDAGQKTLVIITHKPPRGFWGCGIHFVR